ALLNSAQVEGLNVSQGMFYSIVCSENVAFYTDALIAQDHQHTIFEQLDNSSQQECKGWPSAGLDPVDVAPVKSDRPVLILSGGFDPITPVSFGNETHTRLAKSQLAVFPYEGHGVIIGSWCAENLVAAFFKAPTRALDTSCTRQDIKPVFTGTYQVSFKPY